MVRASRLHRDSWLSKVMATNTVLSQPSRHRAAQARSLALSVCECIILKAQKATELPGAKEQSYCRSPNRARRARLHSRAVLDCRCHYSSLDSVFRQGMHLVSSLLSTGWQYGRGWEWSRGRHNERFLGHQDFVHPVLLRLIVRLLFS